MREELLRIRSTADRQKIDQLDQEPSPPIALLPHRLGQPSQAGNKSSMANTQQRTTGNVTDSGRFHHYGAGPTAGARHGTMAGIQVRCSSTCAPTAIGENSREHRASSRLGTGPSFAW